MLAHIHGNFSPNKFPPSNDRGPFFLDCLPDSRLRRPGREGPDSGVRAGPGPGVVHPPRDLLGADEPQGEKSCHFQPLHTTELRPREEKQ